MAGSYSTIASIIGSGPKKKKPKPAPTSSIAAIVGPVSGPAPSSAPATVPALTSTGIDRIAATEQRRYPIPQQRRGLDARSRRPAPRTTKVDVPEIVPKRYRRAVAIQGQRLNEPLQEAGINMSGPEYLAKLIQFESGWNKKAENPSSAFGFGQFIDSTAQDFRERLGVETQDPRRPRQMIKGASMHASGDFGYNPLYAGYNPGYSSSDPIVGVDSGRNVKVKAPRKAIRRLSEGVDAPPAQAAPKQMGGAYAGSKRALRKLLGPYAKTEDWKDKEHGHSVGGLHDPNNPRGYAGDLSTSEELIDYVAKKLRKENPGLGEVDYGTTGLESGLTFKGYDVEWLPYTHGSGPHDHLGLEWNGGSLPEGTHLGGSASGGGGAMAAPARGGGGGAAQAAPALAGLGPYSDIVQRQIGAIRRNPLAPSAPMPGGRRRLRPGDEGEEDEEEEEGLRAILGDRFRPQRRIAI